MIKVVILSKRAIKDLSAVPAYIATKLYSWKELVESDGLLEARKILGFHDEPLKVQRTGQRSIRLSKSYRAIYILKMNGNIEFVSVEEVNKHEY